MKLGAGLGLDGLFICGGVEWLVWFISFFVLIRVYTDHAILDSLFRAEGLGAMFSVHD
jgi:hypothetical protein